MGSVAGAPVLSVARMRAAEDALIAAGVGVAELMRRAGEGAAEWIRRFAGNHPITIVCGPGNNGGDGYVIAECLRRRGAAPTVLCAYAPRTDAALAARAAFAGEVLVRTDARWTERTSRSGAPAGDILVDCLFGTGASRPLSSQDADLLDRCARSHARIVAVDVPSWVDADSGAARAPMHRGATLTLALGALKPAHVAADAAGFCGEVRLVDIGIAAPTGTPRVIARPKVPQPGPLSHKYTRGMVATVAGAMPGAARLAAIAAARAGAGYVTVLGDAPFADPAALVHRPLSDEALADPRLGAIVVGPGLGRDEAARATLAQVLRAPPNHALVIDGDALALFDREAIRKRAGPVVLTPHAGELQALRRRLGLRDDEREDANAPAFHADVAMAKALGETVVLVRKGATTVIADAADAIVSPAGDPWLSTAGTGDVLAGTIGAMLAAYGAAGGESALAAAAAGVWLHAAAAHVAGPAFIADDLAAALTPARASL